MRTRAFKYELRLNNAQRTSVEKHAGAARFAWNWGLAERKQRYKERERKDRYTSAMQQHRELNNLKKTDFPWMYEVSKCAPQEALRDLEQAYKNFLTGVKAGRKVGFPKFKKKGKCQDSFRLTGTIKVFPDSRQVQLPRLGKLKLKERPRLPTNTHILSVTVKREVADRWFVSLTVKVPTTPPPTNHHRKPTVGVDLGLNQFAVLSDGRTFHHSKPLSTLLRKYQRLSKALSRKKRGSANWHKAKTKLATLHYRIRCSRLDQLHKITTTLAREYGQVTIEDLYVKGMIRNKRLARTLSDVSFGTFQRLLKYKCQWSGTMVIPADRWFPSSKRCSSCGSIHQELQLSDRQFLCPSCGLLLDRDLNASYNLLDYLWITVTVAESSSETLNACGAAVRPFESPPSPLDGRETMIAARPMKQELSTN